MNPEPETFDFVRQSLEADQRRRLAGYAAAALILSSLFAFAGWALWSRSIAEASLATTRAETEKERKATTRAAAEQIRGNEAELKRKEAEERRIRTAAREYGSYADSARERGLHDVAFVQLATAHALDAETVPLSALLDGKARSQREFWEKPSPFQGFSHSFAVAQDGRAVLVSDGFNLILWETATARELRRQATMAFVRSIAILPDGSAAYAGLAGGTVLRWDLRSGTTLQWSVATESKLDNVSRILVLPTGNVITASNSNIECRSGTGLKKWISPLEVNLSENDVFTYCPIMNTVLVLQGDGSYYEWDCASGELKGSAEGQLERQIPGRLIVDGTGEHAAGFAGFDKVHNESVIETWTIRRLSRSQPAASLAVPGFCQVLCFLTKSDGGSLVVDSAGGLRIYSDLRSGKPSKIIHKGMGGWPVVEGHLSGDGKYLLYSTQTGFFPNVLNIGPKQFLKASLGLYSLHILNLETAQPELRWPTHEGPINVVRFSPNGHMIASAGEDRVVRLWRAEDGQLLHTLLGHDDAITTLCFSPNGQILISAGADGSLRRWSVATGDELPSQPGLSDRSGTAQPVSRIAFSPQGDQVVVVRVAQSLPYNSTITLLDSTTMQSVGQPVGTANAFIYAIAYSSDGRLLATADSTNHLRIWDLKERSQLFDYVGPTPSDALKAAATAISFAENDSVLVAGFADGNVEVRELKSGSVVRALRGHRTSITAIMVIQNSHRIVTASGPITTIPFNGARLLEPDDAIRIWDLATGEERLRTREFAGGIIAMDLSPDGREAILACGDLSLHLIELNDAREVARYQMPILTDVQGAHVKGPLVVTINSEGRSELIDLNRGTHWMLYAGHGIAAKLPVGAIFSGDGSTLVVLTGDHWTIFKHDESGPREVAVLQDPLEADAVLPIFFGGPVLGPRVELSWDGKAIVIQDRDGVSAYSGDTGKFLKHLPLDLDTWLATSPDGRRVTIGGDGAIKVVDVASGAMVCSAKLRPDSGTPSATAFSPSGRRFVILTSSGQLYQIEMSGAITETQGFDRIAPGYSIAYTPDDGYIVATDLNDRITCWESRTGTRIAQIQTDAKRLRFGALSREGMMCGWGENGFIGIWDLRQVQLDYELVRGLSSSTLLSWAQWRTNLRTDGPDVVAHSENPNFGWSPQWTNVTGTSPRLFSHPLPDFMIESSTKAMVTTTATELRSIISREESQRHDYIERRASDWEDKFEGFRYVEQKNEDGSTSRHPVAARQVEGTTGRFVGSPQGVPDYALWWEAQSKARNVSGTAGATPLLLESVRYAYLQRLGGLQVQQAYRQMELETSRELQRNPNDEESLSYLAEARLMQQDPQGAIAICEKALSLNNEQSILRQNIRATRAMSLAMANRPYEAILEYEQLLNHVTDPTIRIQLACRCAFAFQSTHNYIDAERMLNSAMGPVPLQSQSSPQWQQAKQQLQVLQLLIESLRVAPILPAYLVINAPPLPNSDPGLRAGDIIVSATGILYDCPTPKTWNDLIWVVAMRDVELKVFRAGRAEILHVKTFQGITVHDLASGTDPVVGVMEANGQAAAAGIEKGDLLWAVDGARLKTQDQLEKFRDAARVPYQLTIRRYRWLPNGGPAYSRTQTGEPQLDVTGQPQWDFKEFNVELKPGPIGVATWPLSLIRPGPWKH